MSCSSPSTHSIDPFVHSLSSNVQNCNTRPDHTCANRTSLRPPLPATSRTDRLLPRGFNSVAAFSRRHRNASRSGVRPPAVTRRSGNRETPKLGALPIDDCRQRPVAEFEIGTGGCGKFCERGSRSRVMRLLSGGESRSQAARSKKPRER